MPFSSSTPSGVSPDDAHDVPSGAGDPRVALSVLATIDPVLRDSAVFGLVVGAPRVVALRHDIRASEGALRRVVVDATGVVEDEVVPLEHACLSCAVREDAVPTLRRLAHGARQARVLERHDLVLDHAGRVDDDPAQRALGRPDVVPERDDAGRPDDEPEHRAVAQHGVDRRQDAQRDAQVPGA